MRKCRTCKDVLSEKMFDSCKKSCIGCRQKKVCNVCGEDKPLDQFCKDKRKKHGVSNPCRKCGNARTLAYKHENPELTREGTARYRAANEERIRESHARCIAKDPDKERRRKTKWRKDNPEKEKAGRVRYKELYPEKFLASKVKSREKQKHVRNATHQNKMKTDPIYRITFRCRTLIANSLSGKGYGKGAKKTIELLGADFETVWAHLQKTWFDTYGRELQDDEYYEIDHIIPNCSAKTEEGVVALQNYKNLQLLNKKDHRVKTTKDITSWS